MSLGLYPNASGGGGYKGPFIPTQAIWRLNAPAELHEKCLAPDGFRLARLERKTRGGDKKGETPFPELPQDCKWEPVTPNREAYLTDLRIKRLCLLVDAGVGKTTALQQTQFLRSLAPGHLTLGVRFATLPASSHEFMDRLCDELCRLAKTTSLPRLQLPQARLLLERKIRQGQFSLLVDALDQTLSAVDGGKNPHEIAAALAGFLASYPGVRCVVTGRPHAVVSRFWTDLFTVGDTWEFAQLAVFTEEEQKTYVGDGWEKMKYLEADVISVPRMLETVRNMAPDELDGVRTLSDLYWRALDDTLKKARDAQPGSIGSSEAEWLFALLAIEMHQEGEGNFYGVESASFDAFVMRVFNNRMKPPNQPKYQQFDTWKDLRDELKEIGKLNEVLEFAVLDAGKDQQIFFRDRTMQDFFAALWIARYADATDRAWLRKHLHFWGRFNEHAAEGERHQFWRLATEMPLLARECDDVWPQSMSVLFLPDALNPQDRRSTEMMFRAWPGLLQAAGLLHKCRGWWTEPGMGDEKDVIARLQRDVAQRVAAGKLQYDPGMDLPLEAKTAALHVLEQFLAEFPAIVKGDRRIPGRRDARKLAKAFRDDWLKEILISASPFAMGSPEEPEEDGRDEDEKQHPVRLTRPYAMSCYQTTNALFEVYEPGHKRERDDYSREDNQPVIYVDYWDAAVFSFWIGGRLPTEAEWEFACRAGTKTAFNFGNVLNGDQATCDGQYPYGTTDKRPSATKTTKVGHYAPNEPFGLYDMHGNVFEWCSDWYAGDYYGRSQHEVEDPQGPAAGSSRVIRGGSWYNLARYCRSAYRFSNVPTDRDNYVGFRVVCEFS